MDTCHCKVIKIVNGFLQIAMKILPGGQLIEHFVLTLLKLIVVHDSSVH